MSNKIESGPIRVEPILPARKKAIPVVAGIAASVAMTIIIGWCAIQISNQAKPGAPANADGPTQPSKPVAPVKVDAPTQPSKPAQAVVPLTKAEADAKSAVLSPAEITKIVGPLAERSPGAVVVGVIDPYKEVVVGWGTDLSGKKADGDTVFETASVSKVFGGVLLAQMIQSGEVKLEQPLSEVMKERLPRYQGTPVTLMQLATHSSGLPTWPDNRGSTESAYNHSDLCRYLGRCNLPFKPGSNVLYSNTGFALLGDALSERAGKPFEQLLQERICRPLGMKDTHVGLQQSDRKRLAIGHSYNHRAARSSAPTASGAADGIRSTVNDMLKFLSACIGVRRTPLDPALSIASDHYIVLDDQYDSGLGWFLDITDNTVEKSGRIAGYRTHIAYSPDAKVAVAIFSGWDQFPSPELGKTILTKMKQRVGLVR